MHHRDNANEYGIFGRLPHKDLIYNWGKRRVRGGVYMDGNLWNDIYVVESIEHKGYDGMGKLILKGK